MKLVVLWASAVLAVALSPAAAAQVAILQIQVVEGDGAVHAPGARSPRPLTVEVTDETGRPVEGAAVSFRMPEEGPSATFLNGLRTEVRITGARGRASVRGIECNRVAGRFQIRIVASREQARAGTVSQQYITEPAGTAATATRGARAGGGRRKWIAVAAIAGGGALAGILAGRSGATSAQTAAPPSIGTPIITVGKP